MHKVVKYIRQHAFAILFWMGACSLFGMLRFDNSERIYFPVDDQIVLWLVDEIVATGNWQPDWYRVDEKLQRSEYFQQQAEGADMPHPHHYNFSGHILSAAVIVKCLRTLGVQTPTITLLHHISFFWDSVSWLLLIGCARRLNNNINFARCAALLYAVFPLAVQGSIYARPDAFLTCMGTAILYFALSATQYKRWQWLLVTAATLTAAIIGKASQLMLGLLPALALSAPLLFAPARRTWRELATLTGNGLLLLLLIALFCNAVFAAADMTAQDFWLSLQAIQIYYYHPGPPDTLEHYSYTAQLLKIAHYFYTTLGWPLIAGLLIGSLALWRRTDKTAALLLTTTPLVFLLYFASVPAFFDRSFCPLAANIVLLCAAGLYAAFERIPVIQQQSALQLFFTALAAWQPASINYHLYTDLLREHHNDKRLAFQQQLKQQWSEKYGHEFWIKNISISDTFSQTAPPPISGKPRIYVAQDLNEWSSRQYLQTLRDNGFMEIAEYRGGFADLPTCSLITVHEAARYVYFVRKRDLDSAQE